MALKFFELTEILDLGLEMFKPQPTLNPTLIQEWERILERLGNPIQPNPAPIVIPNNPPIWVQPDPWTTQPMPYQPEPQITPWVQPYIYPWTTQPTPYQPEPQITPWVQPNPWVSPNIIGDPLPSQYPYITRTYNNTTNNVIYGNTDAPWDGGSTNALAGSTYNTSVDMANGVADDNSGYSIWGTKTARTTKKMQVEPAFV